ncbi:MAG: hypothetical protein IKP81_08530 [Paludibacteraceae bacterium]|nr:hypothetical protein [Paludibacteraceae bacterium]
MAGFSILLSEGNAMRTEPHWSAVVAAMVAQPAFNSAIMASMSVTSGGHVYRSVYVGTWTFIENKLCDL